MLLIGLFKAALVVIGALSAIPILVYAERRGAAFIQGRLGPNRVNVPVLGRLGGMLPGGLGQPLADAAKLLFKEDLLPARADRWLYRLAPLFVLLAPILVFLVIPYGRPYVVEPWLANLIAWLYGLVGLADPPPAGTPVPLQVLDLHLGVLYIIAVAPLSAWGLALGGYASGSKYPLLSALRSLAQLIAYEAALGLLLVVVILATGAVRLSEIVAWQEAHGWLVLTPIGAPAFLLFLICAFAETNRLPFDMPECEPELIGGYHTEYSSLKFSLFFMGEYVALLALSALMATLFLGGWHLPFVPASWAGTLPGAFLSVAVFTAKVGALCAFFIWVRWTFPRFRYDQLMRFCWKGVLPLAMLLVLLTALWVGWTTGWAG